MLSASLWILGQAIEYELWCIRPHENIPRKQLLNGMMLADEEVMAGRKRCRKLLNQGGNEAINELAARYHTIIR